MLWMRDPLVSKRRYVVTCSGCCVRNGIVALVKKGVYAGALIKKRRYWPKSVPRDLINRKFSYKEVRDLDMLENSK